MEYIKVRWIHSYNDEPVWLYSELNEERYEIRKVEIYADGHSDYASTTKETGKTGLGVYPVPQLVELAVDARFEPYEITKEEFERVWADGISRAR